MIKIFQALPLQLLQLFAFKFVRGGGEPGSRLSLEGVPRRDSQIVMIILVHKSLSAFYLTFLPKMYNFMHIYLLQLGYYLLNDSFLSPAHMNTCPCTKLAIMPLLPNAYAQTWSQPQSWSENTVHMRTRTVCSTSCLYSDQVAELHCLQYSKVQVGVVMFIQVLVSCSMAARKCVLHNGFLFKTNLIK